MLFKHNFLESKEHTLPSVLFPLGPQSFVADRGWKWVFQSAAFPLHFHSQDLGWTSFSWSCLGWEVDLLLWTLLPPFYVSAVMFLFTWLAAKLLFHPFQQRVRGLLMLSPNQPIHLFHFNNCSSSYWICLYVESLYLWMKLYKIVILTWK